MSPRQPPRNLPASVRQRLFNIAQDRGEDFQALLTRYALERLLYRISRSEHRTRFVLKGAMLFYAWSGQPHRPTRDLDLLGLGERRIPVLEGMFREICRVSVEDDGLEFREDSVRGERIQETAEYAAVRITLTAELARAKLSLQIDVGFGDRVVPGTQNVVFPTILDFPAPRLRGYPRESVVAEKFQAMVVLGIANSRMKDFFDIWVLSQHFPFRGETLCRALRATFERRQTGLPTESPLALTPAFSNDRVKQAQWSAFLRKGRLDVGGKGLADVVRFLSEFLMPPTLAVATDKPFAMVWPAAGPWQSAGRETGE